MASRRWPGSSPFLDSGSLTGKCDPSQVLVMLRRIITILTGVILAIVAVVLLGTQLQ